MALQVWLPLNGDIKNQGLGNIQTAVSGASISSSGKIGQCYQFDGSDDYISLNGQDLNNIFKGGNYKFSIAFWVLHADSTRAVIFGDYDLSGSIDFNIELSTSHLIRFYWENNPSKTFSDSSVELNTWTHVCVTYNGSKVCLYKNGIKQSDEYSGTLPSKNKTSGSFYLGRDSRTGNTTLNGKLNDFRIYDHCLSEDEIHEISLGKVGHWCLDDYEISRSGLTSVTWNQLIQNGNFSNGSTGWPTTSQFKNFVVSNNTLTGDITAQKGAIIGLLQTGLNVISGHKYIIKFSVLWTTTYSGTGKLQMTPYFLISSNSYSTSPQVQLSPNKWKHNIQTYTASVTSSSAELRFFIINYSDGYHIANSDKLSYRNVQLFDLTQMFGSGNEPTAEQFEEMFPLHYYPYDTGTVKNLKLPIPDISGYHNDLTVNGNPTLSDDSVRYDKSTLFNGTNYLSCTSPSSEVQTISLWAKWNSIPSGQSVVLVDNKSGIGFGLMSTGILCSTSSAGNSYTFNKSNIVASTWYHFVIVKTSTTGRDLYINGIKQTATSNVSTWNYGIDQFQLGKRSTTSDGFSGKLSDVRLYATALSADDVQKLYKLGNI